MNTKMTAIANPIRTLSGSSGAMTLDQMAQMLTAANGSVTDILAALTEKGVDTTGAGLSDVAALIAGIQAGGGGAIVETGTVTMSSSSTDYKVTTQHGDTRPDIFAWFETPQSSVSFTSTSTVSNIYSELAVKIPDSDAASSAKADVYLIGKVATTTFYMPYVKLNTSINGAPEYYTRLNMGTVNAKLKSGATYTWIAIWMQGG